MNKKFRVNIFSDEVVSTTVSDGLERLLKLVLVIVLMKVSHLIWQ